MQIVKDVRRRLENVINAAVCRKSFKPKLETGIVSFTFDDFPRSAYTVAGKILKSRKVRGTYCASFGLMGQAGTDGGMFREEVLRGLLRSRS